VREREREGEGGRGEKGYVQKKPKRSRE